jgi:hypothetical protein
MGLLALGLMMAVLPSSLHVPQTGPNGQAEVAPVPGSGQTQSNLSQLGLADSGTVGGGGNGVLADGGAQTPPASLILPGSTSARIASSHHCFGNPPRQTEDPLSPPCVAAWHGDNGGATWRGVTANTITVAVPVGQSSDRQDITTSPSPGDSPYLQTLKLMLRYFQSSYETYGRTVHLIGVQDHVDAQIIAAEAEQLGVFAAIAPTATASYMRAMATRHIVALDQFPVGYNGASYFPPPTRRDLLMNAPYYYSLRPDLEATADATATWICRQLVGRPAVHAVDPALAQKTRVFALDEYSKNPAPGAALQAALKARCGLDVPAIQDADTTALAQWKSQGVTSVIVENEEQVSSQAPLVNFSPEWVIDSNMSEADSLPSRDSTQAEWAGAIGITWMWRLPTYSNTYWWQAFTRVGPGLSPDTSTGWGTYEALQQLFSAIQTAGPRLTPSSVQRGLASYSRTEVDPTSPSAGFSPGDPTFFKSWVIEHWDPTGVAPGGNHPTSVYQNVNGCWIGPGGGRGYTVEAIPTGDHTVDPGSCGADRADASGLVANDAQG